LLCSGAAGCAHLGPEPRVVQQPGDGRRQLLGLVRGDEQTLAATPDDALVAVDVRGHDRGAGGHRLEQHDPERFAAGRRRREDLRRAEELCLLGVRHAPEEFDRLETTGGHISSRLAFLRPRADHQQPVLVPGPAQDAVRLEQVEQALARLVAADEQDVGCPVLPACQRDGAGEARDVDAVGDDLVVAGEEAVDEMACRRADGDPAVQPSCVVLHDPAADLVRGREAGIGMERGDVHAARLAQQEER